MQHLRRFAMFETRSRPACSPSPAVTHGRLFAEVPRGIDEQIQHLVDRLRPAHDRLVALVADDSVSLVMQVVRYFHDPNGVEAPSDGSPWEPSHPRPLGWHLDSSILDFLVSTRTEFDVDEYDMSNGAEPS